MNTLEQEPYEKIFDFNTFSAIIKKHSIFYRFYNGEQLENGERNYMEYMIPSHFKNTIEPDDIGGRIEIKFKDRRGSEMIFIHYQPSDLKGMFEFIGRGYRLQQFK